MPLPQKESFENLLRSLTINKPEDLLAYKSITAIDCQEAIDSNQEILLPRYDLWYQENELTLNSLIAKVQKELEAKTHKASRDIVLIILCLYSLHRQKNELPVDSFNEILSWVTNADLTQYYVFPKFKQPEDLLVDKFYLKLGSFEISKLDLRKLEYQCKKAKSNFFDKYKPNLQNRLAIYRKFFSTKVINFISFKEKFYSASDTYKNIGNAYFTNLSHALFEDFWKSFLDEQHLFIALGAPYLHERNFQQFPLTEKLSIFLNIGGGTYGYVSLIQINTKSLLELAGADLKIPQIVSELELNFDVDANTVISPSLKTFTLFVSKAKRHFLEERIDESFLHFVIALDLIFGEKDSATKSIVSRVSIVTYKKFGKDFQAQKAEIDKIYDARSKYVHKGISPAKSLNEQVEKICEEVLFCLLRINKKLNENTESKWWVKNLDFLVSAIEAGRELEDTEFEKMGIWVSK